MLIQIIVKVVVLLSVVAHALPPHSSSMPAGLIGRDISVDLTKRQCTFVPNSAGGDDWQCDNHHVKLNTLITKIQDITHGGGASKEAHAYFYTNLREPTSDESSSGKEPNTVIWQRWIFLWFARRGIGFDKFYGAWNGIDPVWYKKQLDNTDTHGPLDTNDLDQTNPWPFAKTPPAAQILEMCFMQALAAAAINPDVYLFTKKGEKWQEYSHWAMVEYWKLTQNKNV